MALLPQDKGDMLVESKPLRCTGALDRKKDRNNFVPNNYTRERVGCRKHQIFFSELHDLGHTIDTFKLMIYIYHK